MLYSSYVYYSEWGHKPRVTRTNLDGSDATFVAQHNISNPNGLAILDGTLYLADSNYDLKAPKKHVSMLIESESDNRGNVSKPHWKQLGSLYHHLHTPFGVAVTEDKVFVSDWKESHLNGGDIYFFHPCNNVIDVDLITK